MRSRLDDIVDEEAQAHGCWTTDTVLAKKVAAAVKRIAERAFRAALEQASVEANDHARHEESARKWEAYEISKLILKIQPAVAVRFDLTPRQPAPAEEPTKTGTHFMAEPPPNSPGINYSWKYMGGPLITNDRRRQAGWSRWNGRRAGDPKTEDRRKAERRKGLEAENWVHGYVEGSRRMFQVNEHGSFQYDRRGGEDRRKP